VAVRVLAVDDDPDILRLIELKLTRAGFQVLTARDGEEGLQTARREQPDVVLLDVMMPKRDGYSVAQELKAQLSPPPVIIMLTAKGQETDVVRGLKAGAEDYIVKPFAPRELVARLQVALLKAGVKSEVPRPRSEVA
jgi:DNA-binding response OmpR family regulator